MQCLSAKLQGFNRISNSTEDQRLVENQLVDSIQDQRLARREIRIARTTTTAPGAYRASGGLRQTQRYVASGSSLPLRAWVQA